MASPVIVFVFASVGGCVPQTCEETAKKIPVGKGEREVSEMSIAIIC